ncbi:MAG: polyribonucleotide nucleotidyltransferase [Anaerolineae bacterium]|nr:polyribonucleotide nucleotidyltransferase [Anaerolineae bacterium]
MLRNYTTRVGQQEVTLETGRLAGLADGAVTVHCGDMVLLVTVTASDEPREGIDFLPLMVDFEERLYAAGRIPGGYIKREGRPSEEAILTGRLVDRPLRPLFDKSIRNDIQVIITALSADPEVLMDVLAILGASAALMISDIPFGGPVGAVRVGYVDGQFVFNPTVSQMEASTLDLRLAGTEDAILMVEAGAQEVPEELLVRALREGHAAIQDSIVVQRRMAEEIGKPKREMITRSPDPELLSDVTARFQDRIAEAVRTTASKEERSQALDALRDELLAGTEDDQERARSLADAFESVFQKVVRSEILEHRRPDGRDWEEIRPISAEVGLLPRAHGSGLFTRGETQVLSVVTLGTASDEQMLDTLSAEESKRYMHHYNFPPFSVGEARPLRGPGRREIGHGALAERALLPVVPSEEQFPYTMRVVSEVLSSNGSTSMASVCGSSLALMDAGVPISRPVAGIAMGLVKEGDRYAVLSDIQGMEDHLGDMDFKVAGTRDGVTALQMDIKVKGLSDEILARALEQARVGRLFILDKMAEAIAEPRPQLSPHAPRITMLKIDVSKIGTVIGPGGKTVRGIIEETGVKIDIEDDGTVLIASDDAAAAELARRRVEALVEEAQIGRIYTGKVVRTTDFGAFVEILPGTDGLVHISQLADYRAEKVEDVVHVGDEIMVMVTDIEPGTGRIRLSRQAVLEGWTTEEARERDRAISRPQGGRPRRGGDGGGGRPQGRRDRR